MNNIKGHENVKRSVEIALLGSFSIMLVGGLSSGRKSFIKIIDDFKSINETEYQYTYAKSFDICECMEKDCICEVDNIANHRTKLNQTLVKGYDFILELCNVTFEKLNSKGKLETTENVIKRLEQSTKFTDTKLDSGCTALLKNAYEKLNLYPVDYYKIIKIARVIANLDKSEFIEAQHIAEAIQYRRI